MIHRERKSLLCPQDADQALTLIVALIASATQQVRVAAYGFTHPAITDALLERHAAGVDVQMLLDYSQACGPSERAQVARLQAAGVPYWVGTSQKHQIRHSKTICVDGESVEHGSLNYSTTGFAQCNTVEIERDKERAALMLADWDDNKAWIIAHECEMQAKYALPCAVKPPKAKTAKAKTTERP